MKTTILAASILAAGALLAGCQQEQTSSASAPPPASQRSLADDSASAPATSEDGTRQGPQQGKFTVYESGQVRPLAMSPDGRKLFAANTPASTLEVFDVGRHGLSKIASIPVGIEPVAVAARDNDEVWVVNHQSDSVSIVDTRPGAMRVVQTLLVGDEPRDIVFAGRHREHAYVTAAHRGQNAPFDPQLTTPGIGRADVWVFDANRARRDAGSLGGEPIAIINLFTDTPRALAASPDGSKVYAAGFLTGNRTTVIPEETVTNNGGLPAPWYDIDGALQPPTSLIVKFNGLNWVDELSRVWDPHVKFSLPDKDVFTIDALSYPPKATPGIDVAYRGVGTVLFNMAVNPRNGKVYVSNTEAINETRFEGVPLTATSVRGKLHQSRISVLGANGEVSPRHLNKHINYAVCCAPTPNAESVRSLAFPLDMTVSRDGQTLYVAGFGSSKIGVYSTRALENDTFSPDTRDQIRLTGGGPSGLVLDERRDRLYVLTRFDNAVAVVDTARKAQIASVRMPTPEPESVIEGRKLFYDASNSSSHGDSSCASCHVFGDFDGIAWDLGNPNQGVVNNPNPFTLRPEWVGSDVPVHFRPLKGPMATQSLRGMANHGAMHWRGDRTGGNDAPTAQPDSGAFDEVAAFKQFNPAFVELLGRHEELSEEEISTMTEFALQIVYPPNPIRNLDDSLTADQQAGHDFYMNRISDRLFTCNGCHTLDPQGNAQFGVEFPGFFGTSGQSSFEFEPQTMKIPHFRNLYQKVGMFGMSPLSKNLPDLPNGQNIFMGDQVRGYGYIHDGSNDTLFRFLTTILFRHVPPAGSAPGNPGFLDGEVGDIQRRQMEQFLFAFDSNLKPIVGQQITLTRRNRATVESRLNLLIAQADAGNCDLVVTRGARRGGYLYAGNGQFYVERSLTARIPDSVVRARAMLDGVETTYTCGPKKSGWWMAFDRGR